MSDEAAGDPDEPEPRSRSTAMIALVVAATGVIIAVAFTVGSVRDTTSDISESSAEQPAAGAEASDAFCQFARSRADALSGISADSDDPEALKDELNAAIGDYRRLAELAPAQVAPAFEAQVHAMQEFDEVLASVAYDLNAADDELILVAMEALSEANKTAPQANGFMSEACGLVFVPDAQNGTGKGS